MIVWAEVEPTDFPVGPQEQYPELEENEYPEPCENDVDENGNPMEVCGGRVWVTGGNGYYNGSYDCYTLHLRCEKCGPYEVECV